MAPDPALSRKHRKATAVSAYTVFNLPLTEAIGNLACRASGAVGSSILEVFAIARKKSYDLNVRLCSHTCDQLFLSKKSPR